MNLQQCGNELGITYGEGICPSLSSSSCYSVSDDAEYTLTLASELLPGMTKVINKGTYILLFSCNIFSTKDVTITFTIYNGTTVVKTWSELKFTNKNDTSTIQTLPFDILSDSATVYIEVVGDQTNLSIKDRTMLLFPIDNINNNSASQSSCGSGDVLIQQKVCSSIPIFNYIESISSTSIFNPTGTYTLIPDMEFTGGVLAGDYILLLMCKVDATGAPVLVDFAVTTSSGTVKEEKGVVSMEINREKYICVMFKPIPFATSLQIRAKNTAGGTAVLTDRSLIVIQAI